MLEEREEQELSEKVKRMRDEIEAICKKYGAVIGYVVDDAEPDDPCEHLNGGLCFGQSTICDANLIGMIGSMRSLFLEAAEHIADENGMTEIEYRQLLDDWIVPE